MTIDVRGRNLVTGLPRIITLTSDETLEALREPANQIVESVHNVLEKTPPELSADISDRGNCAYRRRCAASWIGTAD